MERFVASSDVICCKKDAQHEKSDELVSGRHLRKPCYEDRALITLNKKQHHGDEI